MEGKPQALDRTRVCKPFLVLAVNCLVFSGQFTAVDSAQTVGKSPSMGDDGVSSELGGISADAPAWLAGIGRSGWWERNAPPDRAGIDGKRIKGRRECINHYGPACTRCKRCRWR